MPPVSRWFAMSSELHRQSNSYFQITCGGPLASKYFLLSFNDTPHPFLVSSAVTSLVTLRAEQVLCYNSYACSYVCMQWNFRFSLHETAQGSVQCRMPATASVRTRSAVHMQYSEIACSVHTCRVCVLGTLVESPVA